MQTPTIEPKDIQDWSSYWDQEEFWTYPELFEVNADLFIKKASPILEFNKEDRVLNIGCGPGFLESFLSPLVHSIVATDVSPRFLDLCQQNNRHNPNVTTRLLESCYTHLNFKPSQFSLFLCISVIQYYQSIEEVKALILSAKKVAMPGAKMLIADMPREPSTLRGGWDSVCSFALALLGGYLPLLLKKAYLEKDKILNYRTQGQKTPRLYLTEDDFKSLLDELGLRGEVLNETFSICANRQSLLIYFD